MNEYDFKKLQEEELEISEIDNDKLLKLKTIIDNHKKDDKKLELNAFPNTIPNIIELLYSNDDIKYEVCNEPEIERLIYSIKVNDKKKRGFE